MKYRGRIFVTAFGFKRLLQHPNVHAPISRKRVHSFAFSLLDCETSIIKDYMVRVLAKSMDKIA